jgi:uncharacterized protein
VPYRGLLSCAARLNLQSVTKVKKQVLQIFEQARQYAENRLEQELSPGLLYHRIAHTREEVVPVAERFASMEGIKRESLYLVLTAAWFHDIGFVEQAQFHEWVSARIATEVLPSFGYTEDQVGIIRQAILATALPQSPRNILEEIVADADLDILGRDNFMRRNDDLRREFAFLGKTFTNEEWYAGQLKFVEEHMYFTTSAHSLRDTRKALNILDLRKLLENSRTV